MGLLWVLYLPLKLGELYYEHHGDTVWEFETWGTTGSDAAIGSRGLEEDDGPAPVAARLDMLPDAKLSRSALLTSTIFQVGVAAFLVALPMFFSAEARHTNHL